MVLLKKMSRASSYGMATTTVGRKSITFFDNDKFFRKVFSD